MTSEKQNILDYFEGRFGINKSYFEGFGFYLASKGRVFLGPTSIGNLKFVSVGLLVVRISRVIKPTTNILQIFGKYANQNIIMLTKKQAEDYVFGMDLKIDDYASVTDGYVILKYANSSLGCGFLKNNVVKNMLPKAKRLELKFI
ncbi:hypothetical protein KKF81_06825 [Candidatus Micrarchaeota archaeon]|nr:hypothetical protein [Candidatus Micrarchaeota archaeon]MBU1166643.1 hypothetical protein [Candidatus Micrarchaeota archaeon]MBU1886600.1 hypothetical protein [Candidatus Micrarchaeota archaeon]